MQWLGGRSWLVERRPDGSLWRWRWNAADWCANTGEDNGDDAQPGVREPRRPSPSAGSAAVTLHRPPA
jgi:hypothetical protein